MLSFIANFKLIYVYVVSVGWCRKFEVIVARHAYKELLMIIYSILVVS